VTDPDNPSLKLQFDYEKDGVETVEEVVLEFHFSDNFKEDLIHDFVKGVGKLILKELS